MNKNLVKISILLVFTFGCGRDSEDPVFLSKKTGSSATLLGYEADYPNASANAELIRYESTGYVNLSVSGFKPNSRYPAHVHVLSCEEGAGDHFKRDKTIATVEMENEIHLTFTTDASGSANKNVSKAWSIGDDAVSLVIHETTDNDTKILCINFN